MKIDYGPREKLERQGISSLEDKELLAILIKTGSKNENVLDLSDRILKDINSISSLNDYTFEELMTFNGIGKAKAMTIVCALELSNRIKLERKRIKTIKSVKDEVEYLKNDFYLLSYERIIILYLNSSLKIVSKQVINSISINSAYFDIKEILKRSLKLNAVYVVISHNHPSGNANPSVEDVKTIDRLEKKMEEFGILLFDSIIITDDFYYSMKYSTKPHIIEK